MRLQLKPKKEKKEVVKHNKVVDKKAKGPKISKEYFSLEPFKLDRLEIDLTRLTYGAIESHGVKYIETMQGRIDIEDSWVGLSIFLLSYIVEEYRDTMYDIFADYGITSQSMTVDNVFGKYSLEYGVNYRVFNIYSTGYYLESLFDSESIFKLIVGNAKFLSIPLDKFKLGLVKKGVEEVELNMNILAETVDIVGVKEFDSMLKKGVHLVAMEILGVNIKVHRADVALLAFCNWVYNTYGLTALEKIYKVNNIGTNVTKKRGSVDILCEEIKDSGYYINTDNKAETIKKFIAKAMSILELGEEKVKFKFRALKRKEELKEWELE
jgi:uncharacterized protein YunC (DUF1805 family)